MDQQHYLIVEQQAKPGDHLPALLKELAQKFQLDIYQCRQRLVGQGLSLLAKGGAEQLGKISPLLQGAGFQHWSFAPTQPRFAPSRILGLQFDTEQIVFNCQQKQVAFPKGAKVLAVFAEMSGLLAEKSVGQLLSSHAYRGRDDVRHLTERKTHKIILQGKPVLDLYLLDAEKRVVDAVRVFPGKFDPKGLGERATVSSVQNLHRVLKLAEEYAGEFQLISDFGLVNLPGCTLRTENPDDPETQKKNLLSLARYGWLLADLQRVGPVGATPAEEPDQLTGAVAAAVLMQNPLLATQGAMEQVLPVAKEIAEEISAAGKEEDKPAPDVPEAADPGLPTPPPPKAGSRALKPHFWLGTAGALVVGGLFFLMEIDSRIIGQILQHGFGSGALSFLLSGLMLWGGFHFVRLKRQIENTPTSKVRSVAMGMVEVKGRAIRQYALISPMSHVPCVYYRLTKMRRERENQWQVTSVISSDNVPFLIEDETGRVEVDPAGCRVSAGSKSEGLPGQVGLTRLGDDADEKWIEEVIVEGTLLYVLGFASVKRESGPTLAERKVEALRELKRNPQNLQQFDTDGDGKISEEEWDAARAAVADKVLHESLLEKQQRKKQEEHIVIGKQKGRPLVIAETHSEEHLAGRFATYTVLLFIGATAALGGSIYLLLNYLK